MQKCKIEDGWSRGVGLGARRRVGGEVEGGGRRGVQHGDGDDQERRQLVRRLLEAVADDGGREVADERQRVEQPLRRPLRRRRRRALERRDRRAEPALGEEVLAEEEGERELERRRGERRRPKRDREERAGGGDELRVPRLARAEPVDDGTAEGGGGGAGDAVDARLEQRKLVAVPVLYAASAAAFYFAADATARAKADAA